jgi:hypothetical protein
MVRIVTAPIGITLYGVKGLAAEEGLILIIAFLNISTFQSGFMTG